MTDEQISFIEKINQIFTKLPAIIEASDLFDKDIVASLESLSDMDISLITEDLKKSNYLGNRKIDINLSLNNTSLTENVSYQSVNVVLNDGVNILINFETSLDGGGTSILELTSHADIKNYIANDITFQSSVINTELTVEDAIGDSPQIIRFRDADGNASNIDRVVLTSFSGDTVSASPSYYWAKTTSALQTLANRVGDVIALGQRIDKIIALADKEDEIQYLYDVRAMLETLHANLQKMIDIEANLPNIIAVNNNKPNIDAVALNKQNIDAVALNKQNIDTTANNMALIVQSPANAKTSSDKAIESAEYALQSKAYKDELTTLTAKALQLASSENAIVTYNSTTGELTIGIPEGLKGDRGEAFDVDATGTIANRDSYDGASQGFAYLSLDEAPTMVYFKKSDALANWTDGVPFGKGDKGDTGNAGVGILDINRTSGDGSAGTIDIHTITLTDGTTKTFTVTHGKDLTNSQIVDDVTATTTTVYSSSKVDDLLLDIELGIPT